MKTDYGHFDAIYRNKQREGNTGWVDRSSPDWPLHMHWLGLCLEAPYCPKSGRALEMGCGAGCWCLELARRGFQVVGVDLSPTAIAWAREKSRQADLDVRFYCRDVRELDAWEPESFDFILDGFLLHCLIGSDRAAYLATARRLLKPDGVFRIQTFCAEDPTNPQWPGWNLDPQSRIQFNSDGAAVRYIGHPDLLRKEVRQAGFELLDEGIAPCCGGMLELSVRRI